MAIRTTDFFEQQITFDSPDGPVSVALTEIDDWLLYVVQICINYGSQIGASIATLIALILLSKPDKRFSAIMITNTLSLVFNIIRNVLQCLYFTGPAAELYAHFSGDYRQVRIKTKAMSIAATTFTLLMQICVELSLCLQVRVVCVTLRRAYQGTILAISAIIALLAVGFRFVYVVENDKFIMALKPSVSLYWLGSTTNIVTSISILWFCAVFVGKLAFALRQRRKLGLGQFGPMQILIIMGFQTLVIPATFSIYQYWGPPGLASYALTACAIFLPLSALWASASIDNRSQISTSRRNLFSIYPSGLSDTSTFRKTSSIPLSPGHRATTVRISGGNSAKDLGMHPVDDLEKQGIRGTGDFVNSKN